MVEELLAGVEGGREAVEVRLSVTDLHAIAGFEPQFREKHPGIVFTAESSLRPGDCVVRSRFGTLDGRVATKLAAMEEALRG